MKSECSRFFSCSAATAVNQREINQSEAKIVIIKENGYACLQQTEEDGGQMREFSFDYTYDDDSIQQTVYDNLGAPLLNKAFEGWNGTIFAYGQTGAGKSYSFVGYAGNPGILPRACEEIFKRISEQQSPGCPPGKSPPHPRGLSPRQAAERPPGSSHFGFDR